MTAIAVRENGHLVFLTRSHVQHSNLVCLTASRVEGREGGQRERERERKKEA